MVAIFPCLFFSSQELFVTLAPPTLPAVGNKKKNGFSFCISLVFCNFAPYMKTTAFFTPYQYDCQGSF